MANLSLVLAKALCLELHSDSNRVATIVNRVLKITNSNVSLVLSTNGTCKEPQPSPLFRLLLLLLMLRNPREEIVELGSFQLRIKAILYSTMSMWLSMVSVLFILQWRYLVKVPRDGGMLLWVNSFVKPFL